MFVGHRSTINPNIHFLELYHVLVDYVLFMDECNENTTSKVAKAIRLSKEDKPMICLLWELNLIQEFENIKETLINCE